MYSMHGIVSVHPNNFSYLVFGTYLIFHTYLVFDTYLVHICLYNPYVYMSYHVAQWLSAFSECLPTADLNTLDTLDVFVLLLCSEYLSSQILCTDYMYLHMDIVPVSTCTPPSFSSCLLHT